MSLKPSRTAWALLAVFLLARPAAAHRLDEYLQAARVEVGASQIRLDLGLTPGAAVAESVIASIDADHNGKISPAEAEAYAAQVIASTTLEVDGERRDLHSENLQFPPLEAMRSGDGVIRLQAAAAAPSLASGRHRLHLVNAHRRDISVYLANALVPVDARIRITGQSRDPLQQEFVLDFVVASPESRLEKAAAVAPPVLGLGLAALAYAAARRFKKE